MKEKVTVDADYFKKLLAKKTRYEVALQRIVADWEAYRLSPDYGPHIVALGMRYTAGAALETPRAKRQPKPADAAVERGSSPQG